MSLYTTLSSYIVFFVVFHYIVCYTLRVYPPWVVPWVLYPHTCHYTHTLSADMGTSLGKGMGGTCDTPGFTHAHP